MKSLFVCLLMCASQLMALPLTTGFNGPWHDPAFDGQGMVIHIIPEQNTVFVAWFTYAADGGQQQWMTAYGDLSNEVIQLQVTQSTGGQFNATEPVPTQANWGTAELEFTSCNSASFSYAGVSSGQFNLVRLTPALNCQEGS